MVHPIFKHDCQLAEEFREEYVIPSPYASLFRKLCFRLRQYTTIRKSYQIHRYFRSHAAYLKERNRHLGTPEYKFVIHPFSSFAVTKKIIICFTWLAVFLVCPFKSSFLAVYYTGLKDDFLPVDYVVIFLQSILIMDIICRFCVGYPVEQTREIVLDPKKIRNKYLRTYFLFDVVPTIFSVFLIFYKSLEPTHQIFILQTHMLRGVRMKAMIHNLDLMLQLSKIKESFRTCFILSLICFVIIHWWTCIMGLIPTARHLYGISNNDSWYFKLLSEREKLQISTRSHIIANKDIHDSAFETYLHYMNAVLCHFFGAGFGRYRTDDSVEMFLFSFIVISGLVFFLYARATILELFGVVNISETMYEELVAQTSEFMVMKRFPSHLKRRICMYYEYKFNKTFFSEKKILDSLSEHLRMEILLYSCRNLIDKVQIFKGLSRAAVGCVVALLKPEIYLSGDEIMAQNDESGTIYFILYGTCAVKLISGKEAMHVEDGNHFGELSIEYGGTKGQMDNLYTIVAIESCEIYSLSKTDINYCCANYPEIIHKLDALFKTKAKQYNAALASVQQEETTADDIIAELRRGRILHYGRKRAMMF